MDNKRITEYQAEMERDLLKVQSVMDSLSSAMSGQKIIPFTKDDLHGLYDYCRAKLKLKMEKEERFTDEEKEQRRTEIDELLFEAEQIDLSNMPSYLYYPPRQISCVDKILMLLLANAILARLKKIFEIWK